MSLIKLGLEKMPLPDKILFGRQIVQAMTGNPNFPTPTPALTVISTDTDSLEAAYTLAQNARQIAKSKTSLQDEQAAAWDWVITQLASYVESASDGDKAKIESAGFNIRATPTPIGELPAPVDVQVLPSEHSGTADMSCKPVYGARSYVYERAVDAPTLEWKPLGASTKRSGMFNSMVSGQKYWFRMAAVGAAGQSAWSDPVPLFAP